MAIHKQKSWVLYLFIGVLLLGGMCFNAVHVDAKEVKNSPQLKAGTSSTISGTLLTGDNKPISGVKVELYDISGTKLTDTTSAADGTYQFPSLAAGDYYCKIDAANEYPAWWGSYGADNQTAYLHVDGSSSVSDIDMHLRYIALTTGGIAGKVVDDNNSGAPVAGVAIELYDWFGKQVGLTKSLADGTYSFPNLKNDWYYVKFTTPNGYTFNYQQNKTHFGQDGVSDYIYVNGKDIVNETQEGPSLGTTIHLLGEKPFAEQYQLWVTNEWAPGLPGYSEYPIGANPAAGDTVTVNTRTRENRTNNYIGFTIYSSDGTSGESGNTPAKAFFDLYEFHFSNPQVINEYEPITSDTGGKGGIAYFIQGSGVTSVTVVEKKSGKEVYQIYVRAI